MKITDILAAVKQNQSLTLKYVRVNGEYRFADIDMGVDHKMLANGDICEGAAFVHVYPDGFYIDGHSTTLKMGEGKFDQEGLKQLFGLPVKDKW